MSRATSGSSIGSRDSAPSPPVPGPVEDFYQTLQLGAWGDSLTYGFGGEEVTGPYIPYMAQMANWAPFRPYLNEGISGQTSTQIATRFLAAPQYWNYTTILWMGRNDIGAFGPTWAQTTLANLQACVAALASVGNDRYVIWGVTTNGLEYTGGPSEATYNAIVAANQLLAAAFGSRFFDLRAWMASTAPFTALSLTPDATSLMEIARNEIPTFWRRDATSVHYNDDGTNAQGYLAATQVAAMDALVPDEYMSVYSESALVGDGTLSQFNDLRVFGRLFMGDPVQGSGQVMTSLPKQSIMMIGTGQEIPDAISAATTREWMFLGDNAGGTTATGRANTGIGTDVMSVVTTGSFSVAVGTRALTAVTTANSNVAIGTDTLATLTTQSDGNTAVGRYALNHSVSVSPSTAIGFQALYANTTGKGTAVGYSALRNNTTGNSNCAVGENALNANTTGSTNTAVGNNALADSTTAGNNVAVGASALTVSTTAADNTAVGKSAGAAVTTGSNNVYVGSSAGVLATTMQNTVAIGYQAMRNAVGANGSVAVGYQALNAVVSATANVAIGNLALTLATGGNNIAVGYQAGQDLTTGTNNIIIGYNISSVGPTLNNRMTIGNLIYGTGVDGTGTTLSSGNVGIGMVPLSGARLDVAGAVRSDTGFYGFEATPPGVPSTNGFCIFAQDNGSGRTQLMVQFQAGAAQQIAIQP